jgi:hypothetical protein
MALAQTRGKNVLPNRHRSDPRLGIPIPSHIPISDRHLPVSFNVFHGLWLVPPPPFPFLPLLQHGPDVTFLTPDGTSAKREQPDLNSMGYIALDYADVT